MAGGHTRDFKLERSDSEATSAREQMSTFHAILLLIIVIAFAVVLGIAIVTYWPT